MGLKVPGNFRPHAANYDMRFMKRLLSVRLALALFFLSPQYHLFAGQAKVPLIPSVNVKAGKTGSLTPVKLGVNGLLRLQQPPLGLRAPTSASLAKPTAPKVQAGENRAAPVSATASLGEAGALSEQILQGGSTEESDESGAKLGAIFSGETLRKRYGFEPAEIHAGKKYAFVLREGLAQDKPVSNPDKPVSDGRYDAVVIGGGPAGLAAGVYLTDAGKKILILDKNSEMGGLGASTQRNGTSFGRGGAYFPGADGEMYKTYKHLGLGRYQKKFAIPGPIDSYAWNGKLYDDLWEDHTLKKLPASFAAFKFALKTLDQSGGIADQPLEESSAARQLDSLTMAQWVRNIPAWLDASRNPKAAELSRKLKADKRLDAADPMKDVLNLLNLYGRSALGEHTDKISAAFFTNFYIDELGMRYTGSMGSGEVSNAISKKLEKRKTLAHMRTGAKVLDIAHAAKGVDVLYQKDGVLHKAKARDVVFAAPLGLAPRLIRGYQEIAPEHFKQTSELKYRDYMVINVHVKGHPWRKAYDLWTRDDKGYTQKRITDVIDGRWMDFRGGKDRRGDDKGILTIYMPLDKQVSGQKRTSKEAIAIAESAIDQMIGHIGPLAQKDHKKIKVMAAEINYWRQAIHVAGPGYLDRAETMAKPVGHVYFANNNLGTPSIEEALYRGRRAAEELLAHAVKSGRKAVKKILRTIDSLK